MESSSWIHGGYANANASANGTGGNNGFMCGYAASCSSGEPQLNEQQQQLVSSQIQHHLNQISMHMSMDDDQSTVYDGAAMVDDFLMASSTHHAAGSFPSSSSSSASYRSTSVSYSPDTAAHVLGAPPPATGFKYPEVSSHAPPLAPTLVPYDPHHGGGHYTAGLSPAADLPTATPPRSGGAFRRYARHLGPRRPAVKASGGQRMFKTAMSVLTKMHVAAMAYSRQCYYQQQQQAAAAAEMTPPSGNQLQHMISERKRREKLNDSFVALKSVLPPGSKKDKTSILIRAREYVKSLESNLSELEEKNRELEARLASRAVATTAPAEAAGGEKGEDLVEIEVTSGGDGGAGAATAAGEEENTCTLNVAVTTPPASRRGGGGGGMSTTDVVLRTLQCLREQIGDGANLVAMSTSAGSGGRPPRANLTLQFKV